VRLAVPALGLPIRRYMATLPPGGMTAPWPGCTTRCAPGSGPPPGGTRSPSSTQLPSVPSLTPRSRATCAIGLPVSRTSPAPPPERPRPPGSPDRTSCVSLPSEIPPFKRISPRWEGKPTSGTGQEKSRAQNIGHTPRQRAGPEDHPHGQGQPGLVEPAPGWPGSPAGTGPSASG
jgi:hypothetical protein